MVSTHNKKHKDGTLTLSLTDAEGTPICERVWQASSLKNNSRISINFSTPLRVGAYTLTAISDCVDNNGLTLRMGPGEREGWSLITSDGPTDMLLFMHLTTMQANPSWVLWALACCTLLLLPAIAAVLLSKKNRTTVKPSFSGTAA